MEDAVFAIETMYMVIETILVGVISVTIFVIYKNIVAQSMVEIKILRSIG
jgi:hypothetical protein